MTTTPDPWLPSTTRILGDFGFYRALDAAKATDLERGKADGSGVDKIATTMLMGDAVQLTPFTAKHYAGWVAAIFNFMAHHSWQHHSHQNEFICTTPGMEFVSHPDNLGILDGTLANLEVKKGVWPESVRLQTAGQIIAEGNRSRQRYCLHLPARYDYKAQEWIDCGKYRLIHLTDPQDLTDFTVLAQGWWAEHTDTPPANAATLIEHAKWVCQRYGVAPSPAHQGA